MLIMIFQKLRIENGSNQSNQYQIVYWLNLERMLIYIINSFQN